MRRIFPEMKPSAVITIGLVLLFGFAQMGLAQTQLPLALDNNYMVTGDYVVGGWSKTPGTTTINGTPMSTGTIGIPDPNAYGGVNLEQKVPPGADIVAAFLYWATVENSGVHSGKNGTFSGYGSNAPPIPTYPITGTVLGNPNAPVSWSSGGCAGSAQGSKTIVTYRAEVSALLPVDANGNIQPNATYQVSLPDTGKAGQPPYALGATLVIVYRLLAPGAPLNAVIIYDGAYAPSNTAQTMTQPIIGFYQAGNDQAAPIVSKITHIVANGQANKLQQVYLNNYDSNGNLVHSTLLPSLYPGNPPFPGTYNTTWDNPTWLANNYPYPSTTPNGNFAVEAGESSETTLVVPNGSNKGCVSWGAIVFSTTVQDSDLDGLIDVWKAKQGYWDAGSNRGMSNQGTSSWVSLAGATHGNQDIFVQLDYMCTKVIINGLNTTCDPSGTSYKPDPQAISNLMGAFSSNPHNINVHIVPNDNHVILAQPCVDTVDANGNPLYCPHPGQAGAVDWKLGYSLLKAQPLNYPDETSCETLTPTGGVAGTGPACLRRFPPAQNNSYHEAIFAVASATPDWFFQNGSLVSISASGNTLTFTTSGPHGLAPDPTNTGISNGRVTILGSISNPNLNGTYLVQSVPTATSFTIQVTAATTAPTKATDPFLSVGSSTVATGSGLSDIGGADSLISLGLWGADGQTVPVESGTFMHELGHSLGLTHGGLYRTPVAGGGYSFSFESNCKPNFQSVMNYLFQVDLLDGVLDYSEQDLPTLDEITGSNSVPSVLANAIHPTTRWYVPNQAIGSPATAHCDGTPLLPADPPSFRVQGAASSITWSLNQDLNFDGQDEAALQGYNDWGNVDLRQIGATGNQLWAAGATLVKTTVGGAALVKTTVGGATLVKTTVGGATLVKTTVGGVGEATLKTVSSIVRNPTGASAMLTPANAIQVSFTAPGFGQSQIAAFNLYRSVNGGAFSKLASPALTITGASLPLQNPLAFPPDTNVSCATYSYFVTTVLSDGRESVQSNTTVPIPVPCNFVGFLSPMSTASKAPAPPTFSGARNLGNALPIKWELVDGNGNPIGDLTTLKSAQACLTTGSTVPPAPSAPCVLIYSPTTGGEGSTTYRFSSPSFIINWDTSSLVLGGSLTHGYWTIEVQLSDGRLEWTTVQF